MNEETLRHFQWNPCDSEAVVIEELHPAGRIHGFLKVLFRLARDGRTDAKGFPSLLVAAALIGARSRTSCVRRLPANRDSVEHQYIYWKTGAGCLVGVAGLAVATLIAAGLTYRFSLNLVVIGVWLGLCIPAIALSFRADRRAREKGRP